MVLLYCTRICFCVLVSFANGNIVVPALHAVYKRDVLLQHLHNIICLYTIRPGTAGKIFQDLPTRCVTANRAKHNNTSRMCV